MPLEQNWPALGFVVLPNLGGFAGSVYVKKNIEWYRALEKPKCTPPDWAFGPVWTTLYSSMGYASYLVWRDGGGFDGPAKLPLAVYGGNLLLNWAWTPIFFGKQDIKLALAEIQLINVSALATSVLFWKINKCAGYLIIPYCLWLGVATYLNYYVYQNNPKNKVVEAEEKFGSASAS